MKKFSYSAQMDEMKESIDDAAFIMRVLLLVLKLISDKFHEFSKAGHMQIF